MHKILITLFLCLIASPAAADLNIIYGSGLPEIANTGSGGLPALAGLVETRREAGQAPLFIFGGESLAPSMLGGMDQGSHMIDVLNGMDIDVMQVGKREFAYGEDQLALRASEALFPLVASNVIDPRTGSVLFMLEEYVLQEINGYQVGVMSLLGPELLYAYPLNYAELRDPDQTLRALAPAIRADGAEVLILLMNYEDLPSQRAWLAEGLADIIICHGALTDIVEQVGNGLLVIKHSNGSDVLDIRWPEREADFLPLSSLPQSQTIMNTIDAYLLQMNAILDVKIGELLTGFDTLRENVRSSENAFGNFVADALRETLRADVALVNSGDIRGDRTYEPGAIITHRDIRTELPFGNDGMLLEVTGEQLRQALEHGLSMIEEKSGRFLQISGMRVVYNPELPAGSRLVSVRVGDKDLDLNRTYVLATSNYLAGGGDGFVMLQEAKLLPSPAIQISEVVRQVINKQERISPVIDNRLSVVE